MMNIVNEHAETAVKKEILPSYSVLMSVYQKDNASWLQESIESMMNQSLKPKEIIIVQDGPVTSDIEKVLSKYIAIAPSMIRVIKSQENVGLAEAMKLGITHCSSEWLARMDADDLSDPERCLEELRTACSVGADIVGCDCDEFVDRVDRPRAKRLFPASHEELVEFSRRRTPFCHPAVMMKKQAVLDAGNYSNSCLYEDYDLFVRMLENGAVGCTVKKILFHVRVNENFYGRRGGFKYVKSLLCFNTQLLKRGWMRPKDFLIRSCGNILVSLSPVSFRAWFYRRFLRK